MDVALLLVEKRIVFSDTVKPVCLPAKGEQFRGMEGTIFGWGQKNRQETLYKIKTSCSRKDCCAIIMYSYIIERKFPPEETGLKVFFMGIAKDG